MSDLTEARIALLEALGARNYRFITPTPATHARVIARPDKTMARDLRDVFGWSRPFTPDVVGLELEAALNDAGGLAENGPHFSSRFRVSSLGEDLLLHSAYPTTQSDSVFFGPDSYRFADFIRVELPRFGPINHLADIGTGAGAGAIAALRCAHVSRLTLTDINSAALDLAQANIMTAANRRKLADDAAGSFDFVNCSGLDKAEKPINVVIANPPYIIDGAHRAYRDGGAMHGAELSLAWAQAAAEKLALGGALLLYTGSAIVGGEDRFEKALRQTLRGFDVAYREIDPDVFGEELEREEYADVERIAVVGVVAVKR